MEFRGGVAEIPAVTILETTELNSLVQSIVSKFSKNVTEELTLSPEEKKIMSIYIGIMRRDLRVCNDKLSIIKEIPTIKTEINKLKRKREEANVPPGTPPPSIILTSPLEKN